MSGEPKRSVLSELKRPLMQAPAAVPPALEERLLGRTPQPDPGAPPPSSAGGTAAAMEREPRRPARKPTVPVTFHLPIELRDRIKVTAQAKQRTMLDIAVQALTEYLDRNPASESDLRRLLGL